MDFTENENGSEQELFSPWAILLFLILAMMVCGALGSALTYLLGQSMGISMMDMMQSFDENSALKERNFLRFANLISHIFTFTVAAIISALVLYRNNWSKQLKLNRLPSWNFIASGILLIFSIFILSQAAYWLNQQLPLPDWATQMEASAERMIKGLLVMNSPSELLFSILVVAVVPAIGEELIFRGFLQEKLQKATGNPILAIWLAGFIFSAFHLQFAGLVPRFMLGVGLGYLFYWTQNLWVPIIAHFFINGSQIVGQYFLKKDLAEAELEQINWGAIVVAVIILAGMSYYIYQSRITSKVLEEE
jgi:membrane protease YdiL (CAAX protease family)